MSDLVGAVPNGQPRTEQLAKEKAGQLKLAKVDIDRAPKQTQRFSVQPVPTLMVLYRG